MNSNDFLYILLLNLIVVGFGHGYTRAVSEIALGVIGGIILSLLAFTGLIPLSHFTT